MALTKEHLQTIANEEDLRRVKIIILDSLRLTSCFKVLLNEMGASLQMLSLKNNCLPEIDISLGFSHLRKLDVSSNMLTSIGSRELWSSMPKLQVLYLHDNLLENWESLEAVSALPRVLHLTLFNNVVVHLPNYRHYLLQKLPQLLALDFQVATHEERAGYEVPLTSKVWIQDTSDLNSFRQHLYRLRRKWERSSPSVRIQSLWRRFLTRKYMGKHLTDKDKSAIKIQKTVRGWMLRMKLKRDLEQMLKDTQNEDLLFSEEDFQRFKAVQTIERFAKMRFLPRARVFYTRTKASITIQKIYRGWIAQRKKVPFLSSRSVYVLKSQQRTLICMLRALSKQSQVYHPANSIVDRSAPEFFESIDRPREGYEFEDLFNRIKECKSIKVVRFPDIENLEFSAVPYYQFSSWIFYARLANSGEEQPMQEKQVATKYRHPQFLGTLNKMKPRGCVLTFEERAKLKTMKLALDDYLDLVEFNPPSEEFIYDLFIQTLAYNKYVNAREYPIFLPLFSDLIERVKAAGTIQTAWWAYKETKNMCVIRDAVIRRAVYCIQRWWRSFKFHRRMKFLRELKEHLSGINAPVLYLQEHFFQNLESSPITSMSLPEQIFSFYCKPEGLYIAYRNERLLPSWVGVNFTEDQSGGFGISEEEKTLQALVLSGARIDIVSLHSEVEKKSLVADGNLKFLRLEYSTIEEAKNRTAALFLKTLDHSNNSYIPMLPVETLEHPFLMSKLRKVWKPRNIDPKSQCPAIPILQRALAPIIQGEVIISPSPPTPIDHRIESPELEAVESQASEVEPALSTQEVARLRVKNIRDRLFTKQEEVTLAKRAKVEANRIAHAVEKDNISELRTIRNHMEYREKSLKRSFILAQRERKRNIESEKLFVNQFAQARNMLQKLTVRSDVQRYRYKSAQDIHQKVKEFKEKSQERRELVQSILYEKFKAKQRQAIL